MPDIEGSLRKVFQERASTVDSGGELPVAVRRRIRRRRIGGRAGVGALAASVVVVVGVRMWPPEASTDILAAGQPTSSPAATVMPSTTVAASSSATSSPPPSTVPTTTAPVAGVPPNTVPPTTVPTGAVPTGAQLIATDGGVPPAFMAVTPDRRLVLADTATGRELRHVFRGPAGTSLGTFNLSSDRRYVYVHGWADHFRCGIRVWRVPLSDADGEPTEILSGAPDGEEIRSVLPRPGTDQVAVVRTPCNGVGPDLFVQAWDEPVPTGDGHPDVWPKAWSSDGSRLLASRPDTSLVVLDVDAAGAVTGTKDVRFPKHCIRSFGVEFAPDDHHLASEISCLDEFEHSQGIVGSPPINGIAEVDPDTGSYEMLMTWGSGENHDYGPVYDANRKYPMVGTSAGLFMIDDSNKDGDKVVRLAPPDTYRSAAW